MKDWYPSTVQSVGHLSDLGCNGGLHNAPGSCNEAEVAEHYLSLPKTVPGLINECIF